MLKKRKQAISCLVALIMLASTSTVYAQTPTKMIASDGLLVYVYESAMPQTFDNISLERSIQIVGSDVNLQRNPSNTAQWRSDGWIRAYAYFGFFRASAQLWNSNNTVRHARSVSNSTRSGGRAEDRTAWTPLTGTNHNARIIADSHRDFD